MSIWGIDLGVRSLYVARIDGAHHSLYSTSLTIHKQSRSDELSHLHDWLFHLYTATDDEPTAVYVEEPPLAGTRNLRTFLKLAQTSGAVGAAVPCEYVPVSSWKKQVVGNGAASKEAVAEWLSHSHPNWHGHCGGDQNSIDATCLALYGRDVGKSRSAP